jgi:hypothetical protein
MLAVILLCFAFRLGSSSSACAKFADENANTKFVTADRSRINGLYADIELQYPSYIYNKQVDFSGVTTEHRFIEGKQTGGWIESDPFFCFATLRNQFQYEDLKDASLLVEDGYAYFWLDFLWNETINHTWFGEKVREVELDIPFRLALPQNHSLTIVINTVRPDPTSVPTFSPTTSSPTFIPTLSPSTSKPTVVPTPLPTTSLPTKVPSNIPTRTPTDIPSAIPTTSIPTTVPTTSQPTQLPTSLPSYAPTPAPTDRFLVDIEVKADLANMNNTGTTLIKRTFKGILR